jgi:intracellular septation protein A
MQVNLNKLDEYFDVSYVSPFLTTFPLIILFEGEMVMAYGHILKGIEARGAAITLIVIGYLMIHSLLFKIPNQIGGKIKVKGTLRIFFKSKFFISWKLCII